MALILVIDDELPIRQLLARTLKADGHDVIEAEDGKVGCELAAQHAPDLCITDIFMPDKEGIETIHDLRRICPDLKIIAISGGGRVRNLTLLEIAEEVGADATLSKPFRPAELLKVVMRLMGATAASVGIDDLAAAT
jgi:two-component system chemotaxis response regulator CheY